MWVVFNRKTITLDKWFFGPRSAVLVNPVLSVLGESNLLVLVSIWDCRCPAVGVGVVLKLITLC